jgi:predicted membrane protein
MIQKGDVKLDEKKLKAEDRRLLLSDVTQRHITNEQMKLNNTFLLIALVALMVSLFSIIFNLESISNLYKIIFTIIMAVCIVVSYIFFHKSNKRISSQVGGLNSTHSNLFLHHFKYAIKS